MPAHRNPVDDKTRGARKRYGARAALWGLLTALYAAGRDHEAQQLRDELRRGLTHDDVLDQALRLPDLGRAGEGLVGWAAHRYHMVERSGDAGELRLLEDLLPRAAYSVMEWSQRASPRPHLFDMSVEEAYERAKEFLDIRETRGPRQGPVVFRFDDGWTVQELNTKSLLVDEGNHQHICVGQEAHGYPQRAAAGEIKIYSLRDPDGTPHVTMTWSAERQIYEAATEHNGRLEDDILRRRCMTFGRHVGMSDLHLVAAKLLSAQEADLRGTDLRRTNIPSLDLFNVNLSGQDMSESHLRGASFTHAKLVGANLSMANLNHANFLFADLSNADMRRSSLSNADIYGADMRGARLCSARLNCVNAPRANLSGSDLSGANLYHANLLDATLRGANLRGADMRIADLRNADLCGADMTDANLSGTRTKGARYSGSTVWPRGFDPVAAGAILTKD